MMNNKIVGNTREEAINNGLKFYFRESPCIKCNSKIFRIRLEGDSCKDCTAQSKARNKKTQSKFANHLCLLQRK